MGELWRWQPQASVTAAAASVSPQGCLSLTCAQDLMAAGHVGNLPLLTAKCVVALMQATTLATLTPEFERLHHAAVWQRHQGAQHTAAFRARRASRQIVCSCCRLLRNNHCSAAISSAILRELCFALASSDI